MRRGHLLSIVSIVCIFYYTKSQTQKNGIQKKGEVVGPLITIYIYNKKNKVIHYLLYFSSFALKSQSWSLLY
jgi:hypothetical protein